MVLVVGHASASSETAEHRVLDLRAVDDGRRRRWRPVAQLRATWRAADAIPVERLAPLLVELGADLLVIDNEEHEMVLAALAAPLGLPVVMLHSFFSIWPDGTLPPLDRALPPAADRRGRLRVARAWSTTRLRLRYRDVRYHLAGRRIERTATVRRLARRLGLRSAMDRRAWLHPFVARDLPTIVVGARELDLPCRFPDHVRHVGPLLDPVSGLAADDSFADIVAAATGDGQRIVTCAFGAFVDGSGGEMFDRLVEVAQRRPDLLFIVGGVGAEVAARASQVGNVVAREWIPQRELLARSAAAIVHSGTFTLQECVAARVPMVVFPFVVNDQLGNAERVRHHGVGVVGDRATARSSDIERDLDRVLDDPMVAARLASIGDAIDAYERDNAAVVAIERLLSDAHRHLSGSSRTAR